MTQDFQRFTDEDLCDLTFVSAYIDDILFAIISPVKHQQHLK